MKKLILSLTLAGAAALAAKASPVSSANTFGVLKVESSATQTIICVPWVAVSASSDAAIKVSDLVMTSNLTKAGTYDEKPYSGDMLYYYDSKFKEYKAWVLNDSGNWEATTSVTIDGITPGTAAAMQTAPRGNALIVVRKDTSTPIYLYGQYTSTPTETQTLTPGAFNLIAPSSPSSTAIDLNGSSVTWSNVNVKDMIKVQNTAGKIVTLIRNAANTEWGFYAKGVWTTTASKIQPGLGAWYVADDDSSAEVTFN